MDLTTLPCWDLPPELLQLVLDYTGYGESLLVLLCRSPWSLDECQQRVRAAVSDDMVAVLNDALAAVPNFARYELVLTASDSAARLGKTWAADWAVQNGLSRSDIKKLVINATKHDNFEFIGHMLDQKHIDVFEALPLIHDCALCGVVYTHSVGVRFLLEVRNGIPTAKSLALWASRPHGPIC